MVSNISVLDKMMKVNIFVSLLLPIGESFSRLFASQRQPWLPGHFHGISIHCYISNWFYQFLAPPLLPYPHQPLIVSVLFANLMDDKWYCIVLIWISLWSVMPHIFACDYWPFEMPAHNQPVFPLSCLSFSYWLVWIICVSWIISF